MPFKEKLFIKSKQAKDNEVEYLKVSKACRYLLANLKIIPKIEEDIQKWKDYDKIKETIKYYFGNKKQNI